jgi:glycosyltransferase involved in cell wall biosynthesis
MTVGAVLIVKNEEAMLGRCLASLRGFDEIIVLDTGSTDSTCKVARDYTDKVYEGEYEWEDSFCKARNYALGKSTADVVLSIDADEFLEEHGLLKIKACLEARPEMKAFDVVLVDEKSKSEHYFPRLFRRLPEIEWKGDIHNCLSHLGETKTNITITYGSSPAHQKDPSRAFRILKKYVAANPRCVREKFYLAREYGYRHMWKEAAQWYETYLLVGSFAQEVGEAYYRMAEAYQNLGDYAKAREGCIRAIMVNADYSLPIELLSYLTGPKNKERWLEFSETAKNQDVLFVPGTNEQGGEYYDGLFKQSDPVKDRYDEIHDRILELVGPTEKCADAGCGTGRLLNRLPVGSYGFDISDEGLKQSGDRAFKDSVYTHKYKDGFTVIMTEVLEHVDDVKAVKNIPEGTKCIITVPSFPDASHVRFYTKKSFLRRLGKYFTGISFEQFYWDKKWTKGHDYTNDYITLIIATKA